MVYGYFLMGALMMGTCIWGYKYYTNPGGTINSTQSDLSKVDGEVSEDELSDDEKSDKSTKHPMETEPDKEDDSGFLVPNSTKKPKKKITKKTTKRPKKVKNKYQGYVGNGWWSSNIYFGWEPGSYPGLKWGSGVPPSRGPVLPVGWGYGLPPSMPEGTADWLENLQNIFSGGLFGDKDGSTFGGWLFASTTTTTIAPTTERTSEAVSDYIRIEVTASKDHLKPPPGGWGFDYNPYHYYDG